MVIVIALKKFTHVNMQESLQEGVRPLHRGFAVEDFSPVLEGLEDDAKKKDLADVYLGMQHFQSKCF